MDSIIQQFNKVLGKSFQTQSEVEEHLSELFKEELDSQDDAQAAYDKVDRKTGGLMGKHCVYSLSEDGEVWSVDTGFAYSEGSLPAYLEAFRSYYSESYDSLEDILSKLERQVGKTMDNAGCDAKNALRMIQEDDLLLDDVFAITGADGPARISFFSFPTPATK